jgi:hypothetical protein
VVDSDLLCGGYDGVYRLSGRTQRVYLPLGRQNEALLFHQREHGTILYVSSNVNLDYEKHRSRYNRRVKTEGVVG